MHRSSRETGSLRALTIRVAGITLVALAAGCGSTLDPSPSERAPSLPPSNAPTLPAEVSDDDLQRWTAFREFWGLRSDAQWAIAVAQDPAVTVEMDVPLLPWEVSRIVKLDQSAQDFVVRLEGYGSRYPEDFAGVFIDGPIVVVRFAHNLSAHRTVLSPRFDETGRVRVEQAGYSLTELERLARQVEARRSLIETVGVTLYSADVDVIGNDVRARYQGDPDLEVELRTILGNPDWLKLENYDVAG